MHAKTALPCAWALGAVVVLAGCATRSLAPLLPAAEAPVPAVVPSPAPPATRATQRPDVAADADAALPPAPPSVELLLGDRAPRGASGEHAPHAAPAGRAAPVETGLKAPVVPGAPCDVRRLFDPPAGPPAAPRDATCPGGT